MVNLNNYNYLYFYGSEKGIWGESKKPDTPKIPKDDSKSVRQDIKSKGIKFYTCDDDGVDKRYGFYYSICNHKQSLAYGKPTIDFDPIDEKDCFNEGHTQLWYLEDKEWKVL